MWEAIRANKRRSLVLVAAMAVLLTAMGAFIGGAIDPRVGPYIGLGVALAVWLVMALSSYFAGSRIVMASAGARPVGKDDHPQLYNVVEEMQIAAGMKKTPAVYIIDTPAMNAFATGRDPDHAAVAVTAGLLQRLDRDQLQGVVAHEVSHIVNRDVLFMTMMGVSLGAVVMFGDTFLRMLIPRRRYGYGGGYRSGLGGFSSGRSRSSGGGGGGAAQAIFIALALLFAILGPIAAQLLYFAASRRREYLTDANAVVLTRYPEGLASALEALQDDPTPQLPGGGKAVAAMCITNPEMAATTSRTGWFSTHPSTRERIRILRGLTGGGAVSFQGYQAAYSEATGSSRGVVPGSALGLAAVPLRQPAATSQGPRKRAREAYDAVRRANGYWFLDCECGLRLKVPPPMRGKRNQCPRCGRPYTAGQAAPVRTARARD